MHCSNFVVIRSLDRRGQATEAVWQGRGGRSAGFSPLENPADVYPEQTERLCVIASVAHEPPATGNSRYAYMVGTSWLAASSTSRLLAKAVVSWQPQHALSIVETSSLRRDSGNGPQQIISHIGPGLQGTYGVEIKPLLVATTK
jgi:hypothetical protein